MVLFNRAFDAHTNVVLHCVINETSRMVQWLALSPHNNKPLGLNPPVAGSLLWEFSTCLCGFFLGFSQSAWVRLIGNLKLAIGANVNRNRFMSHGKH